jgi:tetratricopeptide (TPR) repeat protein
VEYLERALSVVPQASSLRYPLAMAYRRLGELDKADAHLRRRGTGMPRAPDPLMEAYAGLLHSTMTYEVRGLRALEAGRLAAAEELFRTGLELAPDDPALRHRLATALFMAGDARGAEEQFEETLRRSPEFAKAHFGLGMILDLSGRHQEAAERFSAAVTSQPDYLEARLGLADALRVTGRAEESLPHYEEIVTTDPGFAEAWIGFAMALAHLERYQEARDRLTEARTVLPDRPELADLLAQLPSY